MSAETRDAHLFSVLHDVGLKATASRIRILKLLRSEKKPLRIKDIFNKLSKRDVEIDMVTIYRSIDMLQKKNIVQRVDFGEDAAYYELTDGEHEHHHITCTNCKKREQVNFCLFSECEARLRKKIPNFASITRHAIEYFGLCNKCNLRKHK